MPEKPSLPPHSTASTMSLSGVGSRRSSFASATPRNVALMARSIMSRSDAHFCCSKMCSGLAKSRIALREFALQQADLRVLAAEAEHGGTGDVRVIDVTREQTAQRLRILPRAAAAEAVLEKLHAVHVREERHRFGGGFEIKMQRLDFVATRAALLQFGELAREPLIGTGLAIAQLALQGLAHEGEVSVLAEHERDDDPVVRRARASMWPLEAVEGPAPPA